MAPCIQNKSYLDVKFQLKTIDDEDPEFFRFEGYASTFENIDRGDDIVVRGAFSESLKEMMPKLVWQHQVSEPLGVFTEVFEDQKGLFIRAKMPKSDTLVQGRVIPQIKTGSMDGMSIGFSILDEEMKDVEGKRVKMIKKVRLFEISLVTLAMNREAVLTAFKGAVPFKDLPIPKDNDNEVDFTIKWDSNAAIKRIKEFTDSSESPSSTYRNAFLWFDGENADTFGAYKLPIADIIDGKIFAIPRGIFASAAALRGARGGVDIPESDREKVISSINRYYDKMGRVSPLEKSFYPYLEEISKLKKIEEVMCEFGFLRNESKTIISRIKSIARDEQSNRDVLEDFKGLNNDFRRLKEILKT